MAGARALAVWRRLDANQLSGVGTALGVAIAHAVVAARFGLNAGLAAVAGAVCTSMMDLPNPVARALPRLLPAALFATLATLLVALCREHALLMLPLVAAISFASLMCMAWGQRAGPLAFVAILALVFTSAWREPFSVAGAGAHAAWTLLGALLYVAWGLLLARVLRGRYAELALAAALAMGARRLRSRAARVEGSVTPEQATMRASIADDVQLAETIQHARDLVFALPRDPRALRETEQLLALIELRDMLLASRLDIELLGPDEAGRAWRAALAATLRELAERLAALAGHLRVRAPAPAADAAQLRAALSARLAAVPADAADPRRHLANALEVRLGHMLDEVGHMLDVQLGAPTPSAAAWTPAQLQDFVSPQGWPLAALRNHLSLRSPVLRHALRSMLALTTAYGLGLLLPWASHPQWLLLSVAVVLRGNLAQTLARRNDRVRGTLLGCLIVLALASVPQRWLLGGVFVAAVGTSHAYVNKRYFVAATAATLMALVQPLMLLPPGAHPAIAERLGDTVLGALLAWAFCYVLPSWERRSLKDLLPLARKVLAAHAANVLRWGPTHAEQVAARLSRQQAYAALGALAEAGQRTRVEPEHVRVADAEIEALLTHGYRLLALLGAVHQQLSRRADRLDPVRAQAALPVTLRATAQALQAGQDLPTPEDDEPHDPQAGAWPEHIGQQDLTPWMLRRLRLIRREARLFNHVAVQLG
ncbi:MAG: FUSC family protein [Pelomonas sp.]|nr:FUSC family protein [Roseateles sp.]